MDLSFKWLRQVVMADCFGIALKEIYFFMKLKSPETTAQRIKYVTKISRTPTPRITKLIFVGATDLILFYMPTTSSYGLI